MEEENEYHCTGCCKLVMEGHVCINKKAKKVSYSKNKYVNKESMGIIYSKLDKIIELLSRRDDGN